MILKLGAGIELEAFHDPDTGRDWLVGFNHDEHPDTFCGMDSIDCVFETKRVAIGTALAELFTGVGEVFADDVVTLIPPKYRHYLQWADFGAFVHSRELEAQIRTIYSGGT